MIHFLWFFDLFRGHVLGGSDDAPGFGECGIGVAADDFGDAEVSNFYAAFFVDQDIFRFDITMDNAFVVGELEGLANLGNDLEGFARGKFARAFQLAEVQAIDEFHDDESQAVDLAEFMDGNDVRVVESGEGAGFAVEAFGEAGAAGGLRREDFQGDQPVEGGLAGFINGAHPAFSDKTEDFELGKELRHVFDSGRLERGGFGLGAGFSALFEKAGRAKALQGAGRKWGAAFWTKFTHLIRFGFIHTPSSEAKRGKCYRKCGGYVKRET